MKKKNVILMCIWGVIVLGMQLFLKDNYSFYLKWYFTLLIVGAAFYPITMQLFKTFRDKGWNFSKVLGFAIPGITFWLLSYLKLLRYTSVNCYLVIAIYLGISIYLLFKNKEELFEHKDETLHSLLVSEILFCIIFSFWTYFECFTYVLDYQTEKFMNYGFLNSLFHSEFMPAQDMWLSGYIINYYYFGHYLASFMGKISFSQVNETFNLFVALIASMSFILPYHLCENLGFFVTTQKDEALENLSKKKLKKIRNEKKKKNFVPVAMGLFAGIAVSVGGSLYFPIYNVLVDREELGLGEYYYWEDSRYIGYRPDTDDQTINEILPYSNVIGDMHAHHIDTLMVFTTLGLLLDLLLSEKDERFEERYISLRIIVLGVILAIHKMTNYWDFPIYSVVMFLILLFNNFTKYHFSIITLINTLISMVEIFLVQAFVSLPFTIDLHLSATEVLLTHVTSPFYKMCVFWGLPTICILIFIGVLLWEFFEKKEKGKFFKQFFVYINHINKADLFAFIIGCCAIGLMIIPEIIYVKDIYDSTNKRANTVYKVCYQAEILFDLSSAYILVRLISSKKKWYNKAMPLLLSLMYASTFGYGINAILYTCDYFNAEAFGRLDATEQFLEEERPQAYRAVKWIKENIPIEEVIVQKTDGSYNMHPYVASLTANPTVLGWHGHEWIWRAPKDYTCPKEVTERWNDVWSLYNTHSREDVEGYIKKYGISYIYICDSKNDQEWVTANKDLLLSLGDIVYQEKTENEEESVYIIDVRKIKDA